MACGGSDGWRSKGAEGERGMPLPLDGLGSSRWAIGGGTFAPASRAEWTGAKAPARKASSVCTAALHGADTELAVMHASRAALPPLLLASDNSPRPLPALPPRSPFSAVEAATA